MKKYKLSTIKMIKQMRKNVGEVYEAQNRIHRIMMNPLDGGGSIVRLRNMELFNEGIQLEKPIPKPVNWENENAYECIEMMTLSDNMIRNWKWRKLKKSEYKWFDGYQCNTSS